MITSFDCISCLLKQVIDNGSDAPVVDIKSYASRFDRIDTTRNGWHDSVEEADAEKRGIRSYKGNNQLRVIF
jgi:tRNA (Thr-GGU) A37 N-methylase